MMLATDKITRVLFINDQLKSGHSVNIGTLANTFNVSKRTVQRDIEDLKVYYAELAVDGGTVYCVVYDRTNNGFKLSYY